MAALNRINNLGLLNGIGLDILQEAEILADQPARRFGYAVTENPFTDLSDYKFIKSYRLSKEMAQNLIDIVEPFMVQPSRISALSTEKKVHICNFYKYEVHSIIKEFTIIPKITNLWY